MEKVTRRKFIQRVARSGSGMIILGGGTQFLNSCVNASRSVRNLKVFIPMPLQVVIDDVGWWSGKDGSEQQEPFRTGINRNHDPADYQAIADLGRALGIRPQAAFILCEWDKENILKHLPTSTWMGKAWDNSKWVGPWYEEAAEIIRKNQKNFEITLHGVGHEYWEGGKFTRAEWTDSNGQMRPQEQVELHLEYYGKLMDQHNLGPLPESFVPAAFRHSFGPSDGQDVSLAAILSKWGVKYINTPFSSIFHRERAQYEDFGFDSDVITVDRGNDEFPWLTFPGDPSAELPGPTCGMHWPNMLHPDPERNSEVVRRWVKYLSHFNEKPEMMLARNSVAFQHQLVHHTVTKTRFTRNSIELDFTETDLLPGSSERKEVTLKILSKEPRKFVAEGIEIKSQSLQEESEFLYVLNLERKKGVKKAGIRIT